jgi:hypothetical protein
MGTKGIEWEDADWILLAHERDKGWDIVNSVNEPSGSIKCGEFLDCLAFQEGFCSSELVNSLYSFATYLTMVYTAMCW